MGKQFRVGILILAVGTLIVSSLLLQGCGGSSSGISSVSGTVADINRNTVTGATVTVDTLQTESLASGIFRVNGVESGWKNFHATATINDEIWVGNQAVEVLKNQPTMNANIVLTRSGATTDISGVVHDDTGGRVSGARVLFTTRIVFDDTSTGQATSAYDGPYSSMVAITDLNGHYVLEDVPVDVDGTLAASKVGFSNSEDNSFHTTTAGMIQDFDLVRSNLTTGTAAPILDLIESYTMPDNLVRSGDGSAYKAIKAFTSEKYRKSLVNQKTTLTRTAPSGSLIEIDLYWNALNANDSRDVAGYGIYRTTDVNLDPRSIDFVRDPYANYYGDTGAEITAYTNYFYAVSTVDVQFLDSNNNPDPASESATSNYLSVAPLGQLRSAFPANGADLSGNPVFQWTPIQDAQSYTVYLYSEYPTLPLDPSYDYTGDPAASAGALPVWPLASAIDNSTVGAGENLLTYSGPALTQGHIYYWVVLAADSQASSRTAYSYSQIRSFTR